MKAIIFISTNKSGSSREAIKAAEKLGYYTILFTNNEKQLQQRKEYIEVHKMISVNTNNLEEMREEIREKEKRRERRRVRRREKREEERGYERAEE